MVQNSLAICLTRMGTRGVQHQYGVDGKLLRSWKGHQINDLALTADCKFLLATPASGQVRNHSSTSQLLPVPTYWSGRSEHSLVPIPGAGCPGLSRYGIVTACTGK